MPSAKFIFQRLTSKTHTKGIRSLFDVADIECVIVSVAFATESGVELLEEQFRENAKNTTVIVGIRNDITSAQGLKRLFNLLGNRVFVVDTAARNIIFHPKVYLVRGNALARLIVGSANLTLAGLNNNIETSVSLEFDMSSKTEKDTVFQAEQELLDFLDGRPSNVYPITSLACIDELLEKGLIVDEMASAPPRPNRSKTGSREVDSTPRIELEGKTLRPKVKELKSPSTDPLPPTDSGQPKATQGTSLILVWSGKLANRDLSIKAKKADSQDNVSGPKRSSKTNPTGSMNLDQGLLDTKIDQRHYFRDKVFQDLVWGPSKSGKKTVEEAYADFQLIINGIDLGEFNLRVAHTHTSEKSYKGNNAMTRLSLGSTKNFIRNEKLKGRTISLYKDLSDPTRFVLEID